eukprot:c8791_g1_i2.p1 GENE.c8791_g1_i2~~c8791_g1_i2.p1  ORF type:complete len:198 (+),score=39.97 c8791_g1_i2:24-596(+)
MRVHRGFCQAYMSVRQELHEAVATVIRGLSAERGTRLDVEIVFTGHSLGGALATLAAIDFRLAYPDALRISMVNFGSPRVGNHAFAQIYQTYLPTDVYRFVYDNDIITATPPKPPAIRYKHVEKEIIVDRAGNYIEKPYFLDKMFFGGKRSPNDHRLGEYRLGLFAYVHRVQKSCGDDAQISTFPTDDEI